jgi:hypothetical protein
MLSTKTVITFILIMTLGGRGFTQNIIWSQDFGNGEIPTTWTNTDASGQLTSVWEYSTDGYYFGNQPFFNAPTADNGFAFFNSDAAGLQTVSHDVQLTTDSIDCSSLSTVVVSFYNQYGYYSSDSIAIAELGVSVDGVNFTYYRILTQIPQNDLTASETLEQVDISEDAAGQSTVYLRFRWRGNWEYGWRIDDIAVQDSYSNPVNTSKNLYFTKLTIFPNPVSEYVTAIFDLEQITPNAKITIYDIHGQIMETHHLNNIRQAQIQFNLGRVYDNGLYLMRIDTDFGHITKPFMVEK